MAKKVLILGGGDGGTILANRLVKKLSPDQVEVEVVDKSDIHWYQPGFLFVATGEAEKEDISRRRPKLFRKGVKFTKGEAKKIDLDNRSVEISDGTKKTYDYLVIATGSSLNPDEIPGFTEGVDHFWNYDAAMKLRKKLFSIKEGKVIVGIGGLLYKCPVAPLEIVFLAEEIFRRRGVRDKIEIKYVSPIDRAYAPHLLNKVIEDEMKKRGIDVITFFSVDTVDPEKKVVNSLEGDSLEYDLLILTPPQQGAKVVRDSGIGDDEGWIPVDKYFLNVEGYDDAFAVGDATALPTPKTGVIAHFQAATLANNLAVEITGEGTKELFDGQSFCVIETGMGKASAQVSNYFYDVPPGLIPNWLLHAMKLAMNKMYWRCILSGMI